MNASVAQSPARVISQIGRTVQAQESVFASLSSMTEAEVILTRQTARLFYACHWKIEAACDAEFYERQERALNGRGHVDVEQKGVMAAIARRVKEIGCGASTIYANALLFRTFKNILSTQNLLDDKGFYQLALEASDPQATIKGWIERKRQDPEFRPADARREMRAKEELRRADETAVNEAPEVAQFLTDYRRVLEDLRARVPKTAVHLYSLVDKHLEDLDWQLKRSVESDCQLILKLIEDAGGMDDDDIFIELQSRGRIMRVPQLEKRLERMLESKMILDESAGKEGKLRDARGSQASWYVPYYVKRERYKPSVEYGGEGLCGE